MSAEAIFATPGFYESFKSFFSSVDCLESVSVVSLPSTGDTVYALFDADCDSIVALALQDTPTYFWDGAKLTATEHPGSTRVALIHGQHYADLLYDILFHQRKRVTLYAVSNEGLSYSFTKAKSGSPGNPAAFLDVLPDVSSFSHTTVFLYADTSFNVFLAYTDGISKIGLLCYCDGPRFPVTAAVLCQISAAEAHVNANSELEQALDAQELLYTRVSDDYRHALRVAASEEFRVSSRHLFIPQAREEFDKVVMLSAAASYKCILKNGLSISGQTVLLSCFFSMLDFFSLSPETMHQQASSPKVRNIALPGSTELDAAIAQTDATSVDSLGFAFESIPLNDFMLMTTADLHALNILTRRNEMGAGTSLYSLLDKTVTRDGRLLLGMWMRRPLLKKDEIVYRHDIIDFFLEYADEFMLRSFSKILKRAPNLAQLASHFRTYKSYYATKTALHDIHGLYVFITVHYRKLLSILGILLGNCLDPILMGSLASDQIVSIFADARTTVDTASSNVHTSSGLTIKYAREYTPSIVRLLHELQSNLDAFINFTSLVEATFDLEELHSAPAEGPMRYLRQDGSLFLKREFSSDLRSMRDSLEQIESEIASHYHTIGSQVKSLRIIVTPTQDVFFRAPKSSFAQISAVRNVVIIDNKVTGVKFTTSTLKALALRRSSVSKAYFDLQLTMEPAILEIASTFHPVIALLGEVIGTVDCLHGFSLAAKSYSLTRPSVHETRSGEPLSDFVLSDCRNLLLYAQSNETTISNTIGFTGSRFIILSGINAGGKTSLLKALGQAVYLAQLGCFVPCSSAVIPLRDRICIRMGTGDTLVKNYSTFMYEMVNMAEILTGVSDSSLVLIDELGRGTSVNEGYGLTRSIIEFLVSKYNCFGLLATHIMEIMHIDTVLGLSLSGVIRNMYMDSQVINGQLKLLYTLKAGLVSAKYGLEIAKACGMNEHIISYALERMVHSSQKAPDSNSCKIIPIVHSDSNEAIEPCTKDLTDQYVALSRALILYRADSIPVDQLQRAYEATLRILHE